MAVWHVTFSINPLAHLFGKRRYVTGDQSRNNWLLALLAMGEGWHNNQHVYQASARQGFLWWEYDPTFYLLNILPCGGLVRESASPTVGDGQTRAKAGTPCGREGGYSSRSIVSNSWCVRDSPRPLRGTNAVVVVASSVPAPAQMMLRCK